MKIFTSAMILLTLTACAAKPGDVAMQPPKPTSEATPVQAPVSPTGIALRGKEVFFKTPGANVRVEGQVFYTRPTGVEMMCYRMTQTESDKMNSMERMFSSDNGRTWSAPQSVSLVERTPAGTLRRGYKAGWVDPVNGRLLVMSGEAVLPKDHPLEGLSRGKLSYQVSTDGGHTFAVSEQVIQSGAEYNSEHPLEGVWVGKNAAMYGDRTCRPIRLKNGTVLQPLQISLLDAQGKLFNPGGGFTYTESAVLIGRWRDDGRMDWRLSKRVGNTPDKSTRGTIEPTVVELNDGRVLMVMRGSNTRTTPGHKWASFSSDGGETWSAVSPWTYSDGTPFFSPSSCSQLLRHSNGRIYWLGNITPKPPEANLPRYPFVIGEVDASTGLLIKGTVTQIDTRGPEDHERVMLSNFLAYEDRETGEIVLHMSRPFERGTWRSDAYVYRLAVGAGR